MSPLNVNVFTSPEKDMVAERVQPFGPEPAFDPATSTLIYGRRDAVLVDTQATVAETEALAAWIKLHRRTLTTIYITHGHFDHFLGLSTLRKHFPAARAIATPQSVELMHAQVGAMPLFHKRFPGQLSDDIVLPEAYTEESFHLEGEEIRIIEQGRTDAVDTTSLYVPSMDLVVAGDVVYNKCHVYVGDTTSESRANWIQALDGLEALHPKMVVAGHKKVGALDTPDIIEATRSYLITFDRLRAAITDDRELYDAMTDLYPDWVCHQTWLMFGFR